VSPTTGAHLPSPGGASSVITFDDIFRHARRVWRGVLLGSAIGLAVGAGVGIARPKHYLARAAFVPEETKVAGLPSGMGALALQFGINVGGVVGDASRSPQFYRQLLTTSSLLASLLDSMVAVSPTESLSVRRLFRGDSSNGRSNVDRLLRRMRHAVSADVDPRTSIVSFTAQAPTPQGAESLAKLLIGGVKQFNVSSRQLQARERRTFLEGRVAAASAALRDAEGDLRLFYERNRRFADSPGLVFEENRLKRVIDLHQELFTTLSKDLETSRIQEVNDTPTITLVDQPFASAKPAGPSVLALAIIFFLFGAGVVIARPLVV